MNKNLLIVAGVIILLAVGFILFTQGSAPAVVNNATPAGNSGNSKTVVLDAQNDSGESGTATLVEADGKVTITLDMTGAPAGVVQPSHIHSGSCSNVGAVLYPLEFPVDGKAVTTLPVGLDELKAQLPLLINVHKSTTLASVYVSCGDLTF